MFTAFSFGKGLRSILVVAATLPLAEFAYSAGPDAVEGDELRRSTTRQIVAGGHDGQPSSARTDEYRALRTQGERGSTSGDSGQKPVGDSTVSRSTSNDFWFFAADVVLFNDDDEDGYYHGIDLLFDADTVFEAADVYAVAFLSLEGGPWNEYASTDVFTIFGATSDDEYVIVTELTSGYPAGDYDLLIELYDAVDGAFLASYGPADTSELSFLPLEDFDRDAPFVEEVVVVGHGGGGSIGALPAVILLMMASWSMCRQTRRGVCRSARSA